jgi:hypothetical protein
MANQQHVELFGMGFIADKHAGANVITVDTFCLPAVFPYPAIHCLPGNAQTVCQLLGGHFAA